MTEQGLESSHSLFDFGKLARGYDRWYETPAGRAHDQAQKSDVRKFLGPAKSGARLLDVGCGTGHWSRFFASLGYAVQGVDISQEMVAAARVHPEPNCDFKVADACDLPFDNQSFDVVAAMAVLEFVFNVPLALKEMFRCVKEDGAVLVGSLNRLASINRRRRAKGREPYASGRLLTPGELRQLLRPFGSVRMLASSPRPRRGRHLGRQCGRLIAGPESMTGPFMVAEVRP